MYSSSKSSPPTVILDNAEKQHLQSLAVSPEEEFKISNNIIDILIADASKLRKLLVEK